MAAGAFSPSGPSAATVPFLFFFVFLLPFDMVAQPDAVADTCQFHFFSGLHALRRFSAVQDGSGLSQAAQNCVLAVSTALSWYVREGGLNLP